MERFQDVDVSIEIESFPKDAFQEVFKATSSNESGYYQNHESQKTMQTFLDITPTDNTRKQCQMHEMLISG